MLASRFLKEINIQSQLDHPNIVKIIDAYPYTLPGNRTVTVLEMEWLDGLDLDSYVTKKLHGQGMSADEVRKIAKHVAKAMEHAHSKNILHLDLKPSNIFRTRHGEIKIIDFGIAKVVGENAPIVEGSQRVTRVTDLGDSAFIGTVMFASPEQQAGGDLAFTSDIFSFGRTINFLLTGSTDPNKEIHDPQLAAIVEKCIAQKRANRYQSFTEVLEALRQESVSVEQVRCPSPTCRRLVDAAYSFCPFCSTKLENNSTASGSATQQQNNGPLDWSQYKFCPHCGKKTLRSQRMCQVCGKDTIGGDTSQRNMNATRERQNPPREQQPPNWESTKFCPHCGKRTSRMLRMCEHCHRDTASAASSSNEPFTPHGINCPRCGKLNWTRRDGRTLFCSECGARL